MIERGGQPRFADEPAASVGSPLSKSSCFSDDAIERRLAGEVDDRHPAASERPDDLVAAYALAVHRIPGPTLADRLDDASVRRG